VVVLDEVVGDPELAVLAPAKGLQKEAASVTVDDRLDQQRARELGRKGAHAGSIY
jgi:hypothetical protein